MITALAILFTFTVPYLYVAITGSEV